MISYKLSGLKSLTLLLFSLPFLSFAQEISPTLSNYPGGYNISCHGANNGFINIVVVGDAPPFLYNWSNGATTKNISQLIAGNYTLIVTDANSNTVSMDFDLSQPNLVGAILHPRVFEGGHNIPEPGGNDGLIETEISGGVSPYSYSWSNGSIEQNLEGVQAGTYTLTVTDMNGCTASASATLTEASVVHVTNISSPFQNGYNISCHGIKDGSIQLDVAGGTPPYDFTWMDGYKEKDRTELGPGNYTVIIKDLNDIAEAAQILLTGPTELQAQLTPTIYANTKNISCYGCANGHITTTVTGGVSPYTYLWNDGATSANRNGLVQGQYNVQITDANGCVIEAGLNIIGPEREDWTMMGNAGTNPSTNFFGTTDNVDMVFRTNSTERLRIKGNGGVYIEGILKVTNTINFNNNRTITYQPSASGSPEILSFGGIPNNSIASTVPCLSPHLNTALNYQFSGFIQLYGNSIAGGNLNVLEMGFDGANSIIEASGSSTDPTLNKLLLNYHCGRDVVIGNGGSGDLIAEHNSFVTGRLGIGTRDPQEGLQIGDQFTLRGDPANSIIGHNYTYSGTPIESRRIKQGFVSRLLMGLAGDVMIQTAQEDVAGSTILNADWRTGLKILNNGNVGIGTDFPMDDFQIGNRFTFHAGPSWNIIGNNCFYSGTASAFYPNVAGGSSCISQGSNGEIVFQTAANNTPGVDISWIEAIRILNDGKVGIGTFSTNSWAGTEYKLYVKGGIRTESIKVDLSSNGWADYVFQPDYPLMPLEEVKKFIDENKHLPGLPSEQSVRENGVDLLEIQIKLLEKIEELTLYVTQLEERLTLIER